MKMKQKEKLENSRHGIFKHLLKSIFTRVDIKYEFISEDNVWEVRIGKGGDLVSDCKKSYSSEYKDKFVELFRICLLEADTRVLCSHNNKDVSFSRENIVQNVVEYLNGCGLEINNPFKVDSEIKQFEKLLYKYMVCLVEVIFDVGCFTSVKEMRHVADDNIRMAFDQVISTAKKQLQKADIKTHIYSVAEKNDITVIYDPEYDKEDCNYALCISVYDCAFDSIYSSDLITEIRIREPEIEERWYSSIGYYTKNDKASLTYCKWDDSETRQELYRQPWKYMIQGFDKYPFKAKAVFKAPPLRGEIRSFKILNYDMYNYKLPHYFYFVTMLSEKVLEDKYSYIYDNPGLVNIIKFRGISLLKESFSFTEKDYCEQLLENTVNFIEDIAKIDTASFFNTELDVPGYISKLPSCFINIKNLFRYLKSHKANDKESIIIFIYSFSVLIDNLCRSLSYFTMMDSIEKEDEYTANYTFKNILTIRSALPEESIAKYANRIKVFLDSRNLDDLIDKYSIYYTEHEEYLKKISMILVNSQYKSLFTMHNVAIRNADPVDTSVDASVDASVDTPVDTPVDNLADNPADNPVFYPFKYLKKSLEFLHELLVKEIKD